ncbi:hypothetical protein [Ruegeria sp. ANG-R]|nr:hypothetical protein [Ruegeria sp. ANG-R]
MSALNSALGPNIPKTETEFFFKAPVCVAALLTVVLAMICGRTVRPDPAL